MKAIFTFLVAFVCLSCSSIFRPYPCGPVLDKEAIQVFKRQNEFLGLKPGVVFADIGASSGYYDAAMAVFLDSVTFYLNDIDRHCLNERDEAHGSQPRDGRRRMLVSPSSLIITANPRVRPKTPKE